MVVFALLVTSSRAVEIKSTTYHDERWAGDPQVIPGKVWFAYCDVGEGLGYHIQGPCKNRCSCAFNNCEGENDNYLNKFRHDECLTTCYTKSIENGANFCCDTFASNGTQVPINLLHIGYIFVGNWYSYTVNVTEAGEYSATLFGSCHHGGQISIDVDYEKATTAELSSTGWWHNFNVWEDLFSLTLEEGLHVITVHIDSIAPPPGFKEFGNLVWLDFQPKTTTNDRRALLRSV